VTSAVRLGITGTGSDVCRTGAMDAGLIDGACAWWPGAKRGRARRCAAAPLDLRMAQSGKIFGSARDVGDQKMSPWSPVVVLDALLKARE